MQREAGHGDRGGAAVFEEGRIGHANEGVELSVVDDHHSHVGAYGKGGGKEGEKGEG